MSNNWTYAQPSTPRYWLALFALLAASLASADPLDDYIDEGLRSNLALRGQNIEVARAEQALLEARARWRPTITLSARYTVADGGRVIEIPAGDLVNPVYRTLNEMLVAQGRPPAFPQIDNQEIALVREHEQDTRISLTQPLYAPAIDAGIRANDARRDSVAKGRDALARQLVRDIRLAYYNWQKANEAVAIVESTRALLGENLRVNDSLFANGKVTEDRVLRARAEQLDVDQRLAGARNDVRQARSYFNFLINRELDAPIEAVEGFATDGEPDSLATLRASALDRREELEQIDHAIEASIASADVARSARRPEVALALDAGIQGENYGFGSGRNLASASVVMRWKLFDGGQDRARIASAVLETEQLRVRREEVADQIRLQVQQARDNLAFVTDSLDTARARVDAARAAFRIAARKRDEGVSSQVEYLDARTTLTNAELNLNLTRFDWLARRAELEYAAASFALPTDLFASS